MIFESFGGLDDELNGERCGLVCVVIGIDQLIIFSYRLALNCDSTGGGAVGVLSVGTTKDAVH